MKKTILLSILALTSTAALANQNKKNEHTQFAFEILTTYFFIEKLCYKLETQRNYQSGNSHFSFLKNKLSPLLKFTKIQEPYLSLVKKKAQEKTDKLWKNVEKNKKCLHNMDEYCLDNIARIEQTLQKYLTTSGT